VYFATDLKKNRRLYIPENSNPKMTMGYGPMQGLERGSCPFSVLSSSGIVGAFDL
jgi:hypothetical protein